MRCQSCLKVTIDALRDCEILQQPSFTSLKTSAEAGCDLCSLSYVAVTSNYSGNTMKFEDEEMDIIDILRSGYNPTRTTERDTRIFLEGEINDYYACQQSKESIEKITVRVGEFIVGRSSIQAMLHVGVDSGWQLIHTAALAVTLLT